jgi:hypothetical protein
MLSNFKELAQIAAIVLAVILFFGWLKHTFTYTDRLKAFTLVAAECYRNNPNCDIDKIKIAVDKVN